MDYIIEPEVSGQIGEETIINNATHPPIVKFLHFIFYGWLGDDIIECFPVYLISERLKLSLDNSNLSGYKIKECKIEISDEFKLLQPNTALPNFKWFEIIGSSNDDFSIYQNKLRVNENAYAVIKNFNLNHAFIEECD